MNMKTPLKLLILCTGNSARSVIGEYLLRVRGKGRFEVFSAGAKPTGRVNPLAVRVLKERYNIDAGDARSKSWDEFKDVKFDFVITVCDHAKESCPIWPGQPVVGHWGSPDPAAAEGSEEDKYRVFVNVASQIARRVDLLCAFRDEQLATFRVKDLQQIADQTKLDGEESMAR